MKTASLAQIKKELMHRSPDEIMALCLRLGRFKKENKELLSYLLFESDDEAAFIEGIKNQVDAEFAEINTASFFYIKKSIRRILRTIKKYIRYSGNKETEVELLLFYVNRLDTFRPSIHSNTAMHNLYERQLIAIEKKIGALHEDLQYDYGVLLAELKGQ